MGVDTAAGSRLYLGTTQAASTQQDFESDSYVEVGEVEDLGEFGDESEEVTFTALGDRRVRKFKGPRNAGTMAVVCGHDSSDDGQAAMKAAEATDFDYNVKVVLNDALTLNGSPTTIYFRGKVMSKKRNVGNVSNVVRHNFNVAINSDLIEIGAT
jgi:hypothetical protein